MNKLKLCKWINWSIVKTMVFPVVIYGCEIWTIKKAEHWRTDAFKLWYWRRPWTKRRSNQSILKETKPEYSLEGLILKLKLQYSGHQMRRADSLEKTLILGKIEGRWRREWQRMRWIASLTQWTWVWVNAQSWWWTGSAAVHGVAKSRTWLSHLPELNDKLESFICVLLLLLSHFSHVWLCVTT